MAIGRHCRQRSGCDQPHLSELRKTNVPELAGALESDNLIYGRTNNPYDLTRTPSGSS
jgi:hypothetical protein